MSALSSPGLIHRSPLVSREDAEERTVGGGFMGSYTRPDGRWWSARWEDAFVRCSTLHYPSHVCVGRTTKKSNMTWSTRGFFFLHAECACWLSMPTPNSPAIVGLWTRTQCDGTTAFPCPRLCAPSPVSPHPGPDDDCPLSWLRRLGRLHRPARNHQSWDDGEEKHCPPVGVHHMLDASSPLSLPSIPPPPPLTWAEDPSRSVRLMPLS